MVCTWLSTRNLPKHMPWAIRWVSVRDSSSNSNGSCSNPRHWTRRVMNSGSNSFCKTMSWSSPMQNRSKRWGWTTTKSINPSDKQWQDWSRKPREHKRTLGTSYLKTRNSCTLSLPPSGKERRQNCRNPTRTKWGSLKKKHQRWKSSTPRWSISRTKKSKTCHSILKLGMRIR